jgi:hypothetical protein
VSTSLRGPLTQSRVPPSPFPRSSTVTFLRAEQGIFSPGGGTALSDIPALVGSMKSVRRGLVSLDPADRVGHLPQLRTFH